MKQVVLSLGVGALLSLTVQVYAKDPKKAIVPEDDYAFDPSLVSAPSKPLASEVMPLPAGMMELPEAAFAELGIFERLQPTDSDAQVRTKFTASLERVQQRLDVLALSNVQGWSWLSRYCFDTPTLSMSFGFFPLAQVESSTDTLLVCALRGSKKVKFFEDHLATLAQENPDAAVVLSVIEMAVEIARAQDDLFFQALAMTYGAEDFERIKQIMYPEHAGQKGEFGIILHAQHEGKHDRFVRFVDADLLKLASETNG